jgi:hypothetical protein
MFVCAIGYSLSKQIQAVSTSPVPPLVRAKASAKNGAESNSSPVKNIDPAALPVLRLAGRLRQSAATVPALFAEFLGVMVPSGESAPVQDT